MLLGRKAVHKKSIWVLVLFPAFLIVSGTCYIEGA